MAQALSSLLQPQGKLLQVKPDMTEEMKEETKENINVELKREDKREEQTGDIDLAQPRQLDAEGLQQIVLQSGVFETVLHAVKAVHKESSPGQAEVKTAMPYSSSSIHCALCDVAFCQNLEVHEMQLLPRCMQHHSTPAGTDTVSCCSVAAAAAAVAAHSNLQACVACRSCDHPCSVWHRS